jgi:hypothetical protein
MRPLRFGDEVWVLSGEDCALRGTVVACSRPIVGASTSVTHYIVELDDDDQGIPCKIYVAPKLCDG